MKGSLLASGSGTRLHLNATGSYEQLISKRKTEAVLPGLQHAAAGRDYLDFDAGWRVAFRGFE